MITRNGGEQAGVDRGAKGSVLVHAQIALAVLALLAATLLRVALSITQYSTRQVTEGQALAAAEAACSRGVAMLKDGAIPSLPHTETGIYIGRRKMDLQIAPIRLAEPGQCEVRRYEVRGTGYAGRSNRTVAIGVSPASFLQYSRFVETGDLRYEGGATVSGKVYAGRDIVVASAPVTFYGDVAAGRSVNDPHNATFHGTATEGAPRISLKEATDLNRYRALAQTAGFYVEDRTPEIDLTLFDFRGDDPRYAGAPLGRDFNGVVFSEHDVVVRGLLEGRCLTLVAARRIIIADNVRTGSSQDAVSPSPRTLEFGDDGIRVVNLNPLMHGLSNTVRIDVGGSCWERVTVYVYEDGGLLGVETLERPGSAEGQLNVSSALTGLNLEPDRHTYDAEVRFVATGEMTTANDAVSLSVASGYPVSLGLVARENVHISEEAPRVLRIDAALFSETGSWAPVDETDRTDKDGSHPACHGVWDLDQDGRIESPNEDGYDEANVGPDTWALNLNGPIVTARGGSAGPWYHEGIRQGTGTRHYYYNDDILHYRPPHFPTVPESWDVLYWREV